MFNLKEFTEDISNSSIIKLGNKMNRLLELGKLSDDAVSVLDSAGMLTPQKKLLKGISKGTKNIGKRFGMRHFNNGLESEILSSLASTGAPIDVEFVKNILNSGIVSSGGALTTTGGPVIKGVRPKIFAGISDKAPDILEQLTGIAPTNRRVTNVIFDRHEKNEGRALSKLIARINNSNKVPNGHSYMPNAYANLTGGHLSSSIVGEEAMLLRRLFPKGELNDQLSLMRKQMDHAIMPTMSNLGIDPTRRYIDAISKKSLFSKARKIDRSAWKNFENIPELPLLFAS